MPNWKSNRIIINAFRQSIECLDENTKIVTLSSERELEIEDISNLPTIIFFYCSKPDFSSHLKTLLNKNINILRIVIPIFGNLTSRAENWSLFLKNLEGLPVTFLAASKSSKEQFSLLLKDASIALFPYPIERSFFTPVVEKKCSTLNFLYAGRINNPKGVFKLIKIFASAHKINPNIRLKICGSVNHFSSHLFSRFTDVSTTTSIFNDLISNYNFIDYVGEVNQNEIKSIMDETDCIISLSTFHDEDFGVSVAQALSRGCSAILSSWGGHRDFIEEFNLPQISFIPNKFNRVEVNEKQVLNQILRFKPMNREAVQNRASALYNPLNFTNHFNKLNDNFTDSSFKGVSELFTAYLKLFINNSGPFVDWESSKDIYFKIYESYYLN